MSKSPSFPVVAGTLIAVTSALAHAANAPALDPFAPATAPAAVASAPAAAAVPAAPAGSAPVAPPTFQFARMRTTIAGGEKIGTLQKGYFCSADGDMHAPEKLETTANLHASEAFKREQKATGLNLYRKEISPFETNTPAKDPDYRVGGTVLKIDSRECVNSEKVKGTFEVQVKWDVYSSREKKVVLTRTTTSRMSAEDFVEAPNGVGRDFESKAYDGGLHELFTSTEFRTLAATAVPATIASSGLEPLRLKASAGIVGDAQKNAEELKKSVVTVRTDLGSGSGFYIADGYLLTDRHVVGATRYVKIRLSTGKEIVGEVVRSDTPRDVALVKTEPVGVVPLRCRVTDPTVGENVYAIGSPYGADLAGTFTRGVLSGVREMKSVRYFQSDVGVTHGNSGGPLLDAQGNVLGLTKSGLEGTALNFFSPIKDSLETLRIVLDDAAKP